MTPRGVSMPMGYHAAGVHARYECIQVLHLVDECSLAYTISRPRKSRRLASLSRPYPGCNRSLARSRPTRSRTLI